MRSQSIASIAAVALLACAGGDDGRGGSDTDIAMSSTGASGSTADPDDGEDIEPDSTSAGSTDPSDTTTPADSTTGDPSGTDTDASTETGMTSDTNGGVPGLWLLTIDDAASPPELVRIDGATGIGETICTLPGASSFNSLELLRDGTLLVHNATQSRIERVDPCDCGFQIVGPTSAGPLKIARGPADDLFGIEPTLDASYTIDVKTGLANAVGPLGVDFDGAALTWSDALQAPYAIDDTTNQLYSLSLDSGNATLVATLSQIVTTPGLAYRADGDTLYLCDGDTLFELAAGSGMITEIGDIGLVGACSSLASPHVAEACLE